MVEIFTIFSVDCFGIHAKAFFTVIDYPIYVAHHMGPMEFLSQRSLYPLLARMTGNKKEVSKN